MTDNFFDKLEQIAATPGKKDKLALVKTFTELERSIAERALDSTISYGVAKLPQLPTDKAGEQWEAPEFQMLFELSKRALTGNDALAQIGFSMKELSGKSAELLRRVILKDLRCGVGVTMLNEAFPGSLQEFPYMRCSLPAKSNLAKWDWSRGVYSQLKADGMFANVTHFEDGNVQVTSRQGEAFPAGALGNLIPVLREVLDSHTQTHGELTVYRNDKLLPREVGNGILNSLRQGGTLEDTDDVKFDAWDQIPLEQAVAKGKYDVPYSQRWRQLSAQLACSDRRLIAGIETDLVFTQEQANAHYREMLARGLEGTVMKHADAVWRDGDSKDQVKRKIDVDVDLEIVGFNPGEVGKRTEHTFGSLLCRSADGLLEVGVSGFKREVELDLWDRRDEVIGQVVCVKANGVMKPPGEEKIHSLFLPRFVELRPHDKYEADTLQQVLDQFAAATQ